MKGGCWDIGAGSLLSPLSAHPHLFFPSHSLFGTQQVIYMGVVLYAPSLALNAGEAALAPAPAGWESTFWRGG